MKITQNTLHLSFLNIEKISVYTDVCIYCDNRKNSEDKLQKILKRP